MQYHVRLLQPRNFFALRPPYSRGSSSPALRRSRVLQYPPRAASSRLSEHYPAHFVVGGYSHRMPGIAGKTPLAQQSKDYTLATFTKENGNPMLEKSGTTEPRESVCFMVLLVGTSTILFCLTRLPARTITVRKDPALPGLFFSFRSASGLRWKGSCGVAGRPAPDGPPALASREGPEGVATGDERRGNG